MEKIVHRSNSTSDGMGLIHQSRVKKLKVIADERGRLTEMLRSDDDLFKKFGQLYMTTAYPGVVKAWHYHKVQWDHFVCVLGMAKVVLYDLRPDSPTHGQVDVHVMGVHNPILIQIPNMVMHGFKCIGEQEAVMVNCPTEVYNYEDPDEHRIPAHSAEIPYSWAREDR